MTYWVTKVILRFCSHSISALRFIIQDRFRNKDYRLPRAKYRFVHYGSSILRWETSACDILTSPTGLTIHPTKKSHFVSTVGNIFDGNVDILFFERKAGFLGWWIRSAQQPRDPQSMRTIRKLSSSPFFCEIRRMYLDVIWPVWFFVTCNKFITQYVAIFR